LAHQGCANSGCDSKDKTGSMAVTISGLFAIAGICMEPPNFRAIIHFQQLKFAFQKNLIFTEAFLMYLRRAFFPQEKIS